MTTRLRIRDQNGLLNQISTTYSDFFRVAMEYIDNAVDAAEDIRHRGQSLDATLRIDVDTIKKSIAFTDNCGGMTPDQLCRLLSNVAQSNKKMSPWTNGQFGFGVHAFRAFAKEATFISKTGDSNEAKIRIDRDWDENKDVQCESTDGRQIRLPGTRVVITKFNKNVFRKATFTNALISEINRHFDDVLRAGLIRILVSEDGAKPVEGKYFDFAALEGVPLRRSIPVRVGSAMHTLQIDLKVLEKVVDNRLPVLMNKQRRIQQLCDLKSLRAYVRAAGRSGNVWSNPYVTGYIEINGACSPVLNRDDLQVDARDIVYAALMPMQSELEKIVDEAMNKKTQESYKQVSQTISECLARVLRNFRLTFDSMVAASSNGTDARIKVPESEPAHPETHDEPLTPTPEDTPNHPDDIPPSRKDRSNSTDPGQDAAKSSGPQITFANHSESDQRVISAGASLLIVNIQHPDFIARNPSKTGRIRLDSRLINYIAIAISPYLVHQLFLKRGTIPSVQVSGIEMVNLATTLEQQLSTIFLGSEVNIT